MKCGIYAIFNLITGKMYLGSSYDLSLREKKHFQQLRNNKHHNIYLQCSFNKYGENNFLFVIIETCEALSLIEKEQYYLDVYGVNKLYNICPTAGNTLGRKHSNFTKNKISLSLIGRKVSNRRPHTQETKRKISQSVKQFTNDNGISKIVVQIDGRTNKILQKYNSITEAAEINGFHRGGISRVCNGQRNLYKGYRWRFE